LNVKGELACAPRLLEQCPWQTGSDLYYLRAEAAFALGDTARAKVDAQTVPSIDGRRGNTVLIWLVETQADFAAAATYQQALPAHRTRQARSYAPSGRKDAFYFPLELGVPAFGPDNVAPGPVQGDEASANAIYDAIQDYGHYSEIIPLAGPDDWCFAA
jgi:hypothetical protein